MGKFVDIKGKQFGRLMVIEKDHRDSRNSWHWKCTCDCGKITIVNGATLRNGRTRSCGCLQIDVRTKHGMYGTRLYRIYRGIRTRCFNPLDSHYPDYGGRGITVCNEWLTFEGFVEWALENGYQDSLNIERIDNNGGYCPENCKWASHAEQNNNKRNNHLVTFNGVTKTLAEWEAEIGVSADTLQTRLYRGWSEERALTTPVKSYTSLYNKDVNRQVTETRIKRIFCGMKQRCYNSKSSSYKYYGGKGIDICREWLINSKSFVKWSIENGYNDTLTIDRIDVTLGYSSSNCR